MPEYHLMTIWHIEAPLENVYGAIFDSLQWPHWWKGSEKVEQKASGDVNGIDSIRRYFLARRATLLRGVRGACHAHRRVGGYRG